MTSQIIDRKVKEFFLFHFAPSIKLLSSLVFGESQKTSSLVRAIFAVRSKLFLIRHLAPARLILVLNYLLLDP